MLQPVISARNTVLHFEPARRGMEKKDVERGFGVIPFPFLMKWGDYKGCPLSGGLQFGHMDFTARE